MNNSLYRSAFLLVTAFFILVTPLDFDEYKKQRQQLKDADFAYSIGSNLTLSQNESLANKILMKFKNEELQKSFENPGDFLPSQHFFKSKAKIEKSEVFKIIQKLPKGASLHSHDFAMVSSEFLFNLTYRENVYACQKMGRLFLKVFANQKNADGDTQCKWSLLAKLREQHRFYDHYVKAQLTLIRNNPEQIYKDINSVWSEFMKIFGTVTDFLTYKPIFQDYFYQVFKELNEDNVRYLEFRTTLPEVYDLNGKIYGPTEVAGLLLETVQKFKKDFPNFWGVKIIYAPLRQVPVTTIKEYAQIMTDLHDLYPKFVTGFDLVGQEDLGKSLYDFVPELLKFKDSIKFFFHAGESDWLGQSTDFNLLDAILLNTTRIGHGYACVTHPELLTLIKDKDIALEISPISNQVLKLVSDLRNHPGRFLISQNYPVVITCDDPTFWGAKGLSYDWYMAFMALSSAESDLRLLKQLALNSIHYSAMTMDEKSKALESWEGLWNDFVQDVISENSHRVNEISVASFK